MQSWIFSIITPVFSVTWSFRNHSNVMICCSRNISDYYQFWKQLCCLIFLWKLWLKKIGVLWLIERSKEQCFCLQMFANGLQKHCKWFTVIFNQLNGLHFILMVHFECAVDCNCNYMSTNSRQSISIGKHLISVKHYGIYSIVGCWRLLCTTG